VRNLRYHAGKEVFPPFGMKMELVVMGVYLAAKPRNSMAGECVHKTRIHYQVVAMQRNTCELKLDILSAMYRIIGRALHLEHAVEDILGVLSGTLLTKTAAVMLKSEKSDYFIFPSSDEGDADSNLYVRDLFKTGTDLIFRFAQPFAVLFDSRRLLFLDRKTLQSIPKDRIQLFGTPIVLGEDVIGIIVVDGMFGDSISLAEDIRFLSVIADLIAQIVSLGHHARRREELLVHENMVLRARISEEHLRIACLGKSIAMKRLEEKIRKVAPNREPVLLWGESGVGKTFISRIIHELGHGASQPFVVAHCSLPEDLLDRELFGNPASFPGGPESRLSLFERASGGTLYLDEVGDLSSSHQIKILEFLEQPESSKFGGPSQCPDVRFIVATSVNLSEAVGRGVFRKDLLHKLNVLPIHVPPLRERKEDIPLLIAHFLERACREHGLEPRITAQALKRLSEYEWPGNLHEMRNSIIRLVIMANGGEIKVEDLPIVFSSAYSVGSKQQGELAAMSRLDEMERKEVSAALERNRWVQRKAANDLGLTFRQLNYRVKKFGLERLINENRIKSRRRR
jgi:Nif-specific regulatory protein